MGNAGLWMAVIAGVGIWMYANRASASSPTSLPMPTPVPIPLSEHPLVRQSLPFPLPPLSAEVQRRITLILQQQLLDLGYRITAVDGVFGPETAAAVRAYQTAHGYSFDLTPENQRTLLEMIDRSYAVLHSGTAVRPGGAAIGATSDKLHDKRITPIGNTVPIASIPLAVKVHKEATVSYAPQLAPIDQVLASCPSDDDIRTIRRDINIVFDASLVTGGYLSPWSCAPGGSETGIMLTVYNTFRAMRALRFDSPLPIIGASSLYDWFSRLGVTVTIVDDLSPSSPLRAVDANSNAAGTNINILASVLRSPSEAAADGRRAVGVPRRPFLSADSGSVGMIVGLLVHEARHTIPGGAHPHNHANGDTSIAYGGAWALHYYYYEWLAGHTDMLSMTERLAAYQQMEAMRRFVFETPPPLPTRPH